MTDDAAQRRWLLAIDSSTEQTGIALSDGERCIELNWPSGRDQTVTLLDQVDHLLRLSRIETTNLSAIAVTTGPGMFNGLRVGMSVAKGLVLGLGIPLIGVPTLDATAIPFELTGKHIVAAVAAGRGRLVWADYATAGPGLQRQSDPRNGTPDDLIDFDTALDQETIVTGEIPPETAAILHHPPTTTVPPIHLRSRRAAAVAELAWRRLAANDLDDPVTLQPVYLHGGVRR